MSLPGIYLLQLTSEQRRQLIDLLIDFRAEYPSPESLEFLQLLDRAAYFSGDSVAGLEKLIQAVEKLPSNLKI